MSGEKMSGEKNSAEKIHSVKKTTAVPSKKYIAAIGFSVGIIASAGGYYAWKNSTLFRVNQKGAELIGNFFDQRLGELATHSGFLLAGKTEVKSADTHYEIKIPDIILNFGQRPLEHIGQPGEELKIGGLAINASPTRAGLVDFSAALPKTLPLQSSKGTINAKLGIENQQITGVLDPEFGFITQFDGKLNGLKLWLLEGTAEKEFVTIEEISSQLHAGATQANATSEKNKDAYSLSVKNIKANDEKTGESFSLASIVVEGDGAGAVWTRNQQEIVRHYQEFLSKHAQPATQGTVVQPASEEEKKQIKQELKNYLLTSAVGGFSAHLSDLSFGNKGTIYPAIDQLKLSTRLQDMAAQQISAEFAFSVQSGAKEKMPKEAMEAYAFASDFLPIGLNISVKAVNLPKEPLAEAISSLMILNAEDEHENAITTPDTPSSAQREATAIINKLPAALSAAGTVVEIKNLDLDLGKTTLKTTGKLTVDQSTSLGVQGDIVLILSGYNFIESTLKTPAIAVLPGAKGVATFFQAFVALGKEYVDEKGSKSLGYQFSLDKEGKIKLNGTDISKGFNIQPVLKP
ncbi:MAG: hypothetical protein ACOYK8_10225 [Alphaproteobacteria bacterium]